MKIAFYVSGNATRLRKVLEQNIQEVLSCTEFVFSDDSNNNDLAQLLSKRNIQYMSLDYSGIDADTRKAKNLAMSNQLLKYLQEYKVDYCFSFGDHLLVGDILTAYENKIINFHPSILPMYPGRKAIDQAIEGRSNLLGNTAHFINEGVDEGLVILQNVLSRKVFMNGSYDAILDQQIIMLKQIVLWLKHGRIKIVDDRVEVTRADYTSSAFFPQLDEDQ